MKNICVLALLVPAIAAAQMNFGRISGTVTDGTGAAIPACNVTATNAGTGIKNAVLTDETGAFVFPSLMAGTWNVQAEKTGFRSSEQSGIVLEAASRRVVDFRLEVGQLTESVSVAASLMQVQTTSGDVGRVINDQQLSQIALNGRNYAQLLRLIPGAVAMDLNPFGMQLSTTTQRINGIRTNSIYFMVDGAENLDNGANSNAIVNPNVDAIAEVKILTSSYSAEFGGRSGAMVNVVTRSGTKDFHGTLFEFVRNDTFDARSFFARQVDPLRFNNFGWTLGGPLYIPGKWNTDKNRLFFFASQEWKFIRQGVTNVGLVPTADERAGDFRNSPLPAPMDPTNGQPFPNRVIPASRHSRNGPGLLKPYPAPNIPGPNNYSATGVSVTDPRQELVRGDYYLSPRTQLTYNWTHDDWQIINAFQGTSLGFVPGGRPRPGYVTQLSLSHTFSPTMLNSFAFSVTKNSIRGLPQNEVVSRAALGLTYPEIFPANRSVVGPAVSIAGFAGYNAGDRIRNGNGTFMWRDDFSKVAGAHTLKFGGQVWRSRKNENINVRDEGSVTFNTSARNTTRNVIGDVLLGNFQNYTEAEDDAFWWARFSQLELYAQDSWRVNRRLSLELGLRYNLLFPLYNALGNGSTFVLDRFNPARAPVVSPSDGSIVPGTGDSLNGIAIFGSSFPEAARGRLRQFDDPAMQALFIGLPRGGNPTPRRDWGPRVGIALDVFGNGRTSLRTGVGIFYDRIQGNATSGPTGNPPFTSQANIFDGNIDNPAGGTARAFPSNITFWPTDLQNTKVISYNFGLQHEVAGNVVLEANYVGNLARHLPRTVNVNQLPVGTRLSPPNSTINANALRPFRGYANINLRDHADNSNYNSLQLSANRRTRGGLSFGVNYTFSRALETTSGTPQDSFNARADYGLAGIHRQHVMNFNYIYELPFFARHPSRLVRNALGGWEVAGITSLQSGAPNNVTVPVDVARIGVGSSRASVAGDPNLPSSQRSVARWFNTEAFLPPERMVQGRFGDAGRNVLIGPGFHTWDISLIKNVHVSERVGVQFRAESFNSFNHPNFTSINTTVRFDAAGRPIQNYGAVTGSGPGRVLSFGLKLLF